MRVFIIRPFGVKNGVDFDAVDRELIQGALTLLRQQGIHLEGGGTGQISRQGNIRTDMFRLIALSDLVIADVSIHNANVFYELGMRHALRPRHTFLIRYQTGDAYPFDLQTDRYFLYDGQVPEGSSAALAAALHASLSSPDKDSPMFALLPALRAHGRHDLAAVPRDFVEEVDAAHASGCLGKLRLLANEVEAFEWDHEGLRMVGDAQMRLRAYRGARDTLERLLRTDPLSSHANLRLATIYQRLAAQSAPERELLLTLSDQAIRRVLANSDALAHRIEAWSLAASNAKSAWIDELVATPASHRHAATLHSAHFEAALEGYMKAVAHDLNAHYAANNALALLKIRIAAAESEPDTWIDLHQGPAQAAGELAAARALAGRLESNLCLVLGLDELMGEQEGPTQAWREHSRADYTLLSASSRVSLIERAYRRALTGANRFGIDAAQRNLMLFQALGLFEPGVSAALKVVQELSATHGPGREAPAKVLLFTGHMVDAEASTMRFPRTAGARERARTLIREAVAREVAQGAGQVLAIAGGASGGDILFHEVCRELGIRSELYLAVPPEQFVSLSVAPAGADWIGRFQMLERQLATQVLQHNRRLPDWLASKPAYDLWQRANLWMLFCGLACGARERVVVALFNPERDAVGPGGTAHMLDQAVRWGYKPVALDARALLETT